MEQPETPKYATVFYEVRRKLDVSWMEYVLLDMIYHLQVKTGYCYKSSSGMAIDIFGIPSDKTEERKNKRAIQYTLQKLVNQGYLTRLTDYTVKVTDAYIDTAARESGGYKKSVPPTKNSYGIPKTRTKATKNSYGDTKNRTNNRGLELQYNNNRNSDTDLNDKKTHDTNGTHYLALKEEMEKRKQNRVQ